MAILLILLFALSGGLIAATPEEEASSDAFRNRSLLAGCTVGQEMLCPGDSQKHCAGNTCCSDPDDLGSFVCPSAAPGWNGCDRPKRYDCTGGGAPPANMSPEAVPYHPHFDTTADYLRIAHTARGVRGNPGRVSDNYYLVIGDWGGAVYGCEGCGARQKQVAAKMNEFVQKKSQAGGKLLFVLSVGDNFYWYGAAADKFKAQWEDIYSEDIRSVPWFSVMGNHDYGNDDPASACPQIEPRFVCHRDAKSEACGGRRPYSREEQGYGSNALNANKGGAGGPARKNFHMPDYTYFYTIPELDFELLALDWNWLAGFPDVIGGNGIAQGAAKLLEHCKNDSSLMSGSLRGIQDASTKILYERAAAAESRNVAIIAHYPPAFQADVNFRSMFLRALPHGFLRQKPEVFNFYGHTHIQKCFCERQPGAQWDSCISFLDEDPPVLNNATCVDFMTGGGGGCCSASDVPGGFTSISFTGDRATGIHQVVDCFIAPECTVNPYRPTEPEMAAEVMAGPPGAKAPLNRTCPFTNDDQQCPNYVSPHSGESGL